MKGTVGRVPAEITGAPMRTVRPLMLRGRYANPEKELVRMRDRGTLVQVARGTYVAKPDRLTPDTPWKPEFEEAAMAYATAAYGNRVPILMGIGAARWWHAIPRAIAVTVIAVPEPHRPVELDTGGRVLFTVRRREPDAIPVQAGLGIMRVTSIEQTLIDLLERPCLGGMPTEALAAARSLAGRADPGQLGQLLGGVPGPVARRVRGWLEKEDVA